MGDKWASRGGDKGPSTALRPLPARPAGASDSDADDLQRPPMSPCLSKFFGWVAPKSLTTRPVRPADVVYAILDALGIDPRKQLRTPDGRPIEILDEGDVIPEPVSYTHLRAHETGRN